MSSGPTRLFAAAIAMFLFITLLAAGGAVVSTSAACGPGAAASEGLVGNVKGVPKEYIDHYQGAAAKFKLGEQGPSILAGVHKIETDFGRLDAPGVSSDENGSGAGGPMQFLQPTWDAYGVDGDGDGDKDRYDATDAIYGAANYLRASGAPGNWHDAIFAYNHAEWYVEEVLANAEHFGGATSSEVTAPEPVTSCGAPTATGGEQIGELGEGNPDPIALAKNPRMVLSSYAKQDLLAYHVSPKLVAVLDAATQVHKSITISVFSSGHSLGSNHIPGRGADISAVDGEACLATSLGREGSCWELAQELGAIEDECYRSTELIYYFDPSPAPDHWAAEDHDDHIHLGWNGPGTSSVFTYPMGTDPCSPEAINGG